LERGKEEVSVPIQIFISHSERDKDLVEPLNDWLQMGLGLDEKEVRCTSIINMGAGAIPATALREDIKSAKAVIGLLTANSLRSHWAQLEMGAGWLRDRFHPIRGPGVYVTDLPSPLSDFTTVAYCEHKPMYDLLLALARVLGTTVNQEAEQEIKNIVQTAQKTLVDHMVAWFKLPPVLSAWRINSSLYEYELRLLCAKLELDADEMYAYTTSMGVVTQDPEMLPMWAKDLWTVSKNAVNYMLSPSTNKSKEFLHVPHGVLNHLLIADMKRALVSGENRARLLRKWLEEAADWISKNPPSEKQVHGGSYHH